MASSTVLSTLCVAQKAGTPTDVLLVADGSCAKIRELLAEALVPVLWLNGDQDPLEAVSAALAQRRRQGQPVETLHWVSHGRPGVLQVGATCVDRNALLVASKQLIDWQVDQLAFWACDYGADKSVVGLWEEVVGASVYSSGGTLGLDSDGQKHWALHSNWTKKTINWPRHFGDTNRWKYQLGIVSYATFEDGPSENSKPLSNSEPIVVVGYANTASGYPTGVLDRINNLEYKNNIDFSFLDEKVNADFVYISLPESLPSDEQTDNLKEFVLSGGTLLINGEVPAGKYAKSSTNVSQILENLGSSISIRESSSVLDRKLFATKETDESLIEIGNLDITSGLKEISTFSSGLLDIDNDSAEAILVTSNDPEANIVMARESIGSGNVIAFADINIYDKDSPDNINLISNIIIQSKQNLAPAANSAPVNTFPVALSATEDIALSITGISVSDADGNLATTQLTVTNGTLSVDISGGATISSGNNSSADLTLRGTETQINNALATLSYTPTANYNGSDTLTALSTDSDDTPLSDSDTVTITVSAAGDAPVASGTPTLAAVTEDAINPAGDTVANLFGSSFSDTADNDTLLGVAITANAATASQGAWEYSTDNGITWTAVATTGLADATALYLDAASKLRFVPVADYNGTPGQLTTRLIDSSFTILGPPSFGAGSDNPFGIKGVEGDAANPVFADLDDDGDFDAFIGDSAGDTHYFKNNGTSSVPDFTAPIKNPFGIKNVGKLASPEFADLDGDGDLDAFIGSTYRVRYFKNTGTSSSPAFVESDEVSFGDQDIPDASPVFADLDDDGDLDAFIGDIAGNTLYFKNKGTSSVPDFAAPIQNPFGIKNVIRSASPEFADLDGDGDLDAFIGSIAGITLYYKNKGTSSVPDFAAIGANPFGISKVSNLASPEFADLDGDGDLDAFIGSAYFANNSGIQIGNIVYFENTPPSSAPTAGSTLDVSSNGGTTSISEAALSLGTSITAVNDTGSFSGDLSGSGDEDTTINGTLSFSDSADGFSANYTIAAGDGPAHGTASIDATSGGWSYAPTANYNGTDSFSVSVNDDDGNAETQSIDLTVNAVDDQASVTGDITGSGNEGSTITGTLEATDIEGLTNGKIFSVADSDQPANGSASIDPETGEWSYTPANGFSGEDTFTVTITDDLDGTTPQTVTITVIALPAPAPAPVSAPAAVVVDNTPVDPAPAGTNIQPSDDDGDGIKEVVTASDGTTVDGNRDGIADAEQTDVAGLRLINDGAVGSDYGAVQVSAGTQLTAVTLISPDSETGVLAVTGRDGSTVLAELPSGISNNFAGAVAFDVSGLEIGGSTSTTINLPTGLQLDSANSAYMRFNYLTNQFTDYVDNQGNPLYSFQDTNGDGTPDAVVLQLVDGDPQWDGDGEANGTVVDPGFVGNGQRTFMGTTRRDTLIGNVLSNTMDGHAGRDWLQGDAGRDVLKGGRDKDRLWGGAGADQITGGKHADRILYYSANESTVDQADTVKFGKKDRFQFRSFDGDSVTEGQQSLRYIGKKAFSGSAGELRFTGSGLQADTTGDGQADFVVNFAKATPWFSEANILI